MKQLSDDTLVARYTAGEQKAFDELLLRYKDKLYAYINFVVRDTSLADDIFQETFLKAITTLRRGGYSSNGKFSGWLNRIAHNLMIDYFRQSKSDNTLSADDESHPNLFNCIQLAEDNIEDQLVRVQTIRDLRHLINLLPDNQREVLFMRYYQELSFKEIADITGVSINTSLGRMRYAIINIRRLAEQHRVALTAI